MIDYKTGAMYERVGGGADPVHAGTRLQLPLYAEAARQASGADHVEAAYWYVTQRGGFARDQIDVDAATAARFAEVVDHIAGGIDAGLFPAVPGEADWYYGTGANCARCNYDSVCTVDRVAQWEIKAESLAFEAFDALFLEDADPE